MRRLISMIVLLALTACILVDDFGDAWNQAKPDQCIDKISQSLYYGEFNRDPADMKVEDYARAWTLDGQNFILMKKSPTDKGGRIYRFEVVNGIFVRYRLIPTMRDRFSMDYPNAPVSVSRDTVTVKDLGTDVQKLLVEISKKPEYWEAEDKTLYNTMRNPLCRFEDRDLSTLDEPVKKRKKKNDKK